MHQLRIQIRHFTASLVLEFAAEPPLDVLERIARDELNPYGAADPGAETRSTLILRDPLLMGKAVRELVLFAIDADGGEN
jgi:hypothetical protein